MTYLSEILETLKRAVIALILLALGCVGGTAIAQGILEIIVGNLGVHWWLGVNWWLVATVSLPWVGIPLAMALFTGYLVYLCYIDEAPPLLPNQQQQVLLACASVPLVSELTNGFTREQERSEQAGCEQK